ncbi:uncharacterized protein K02A2.6-like [Tachysurus ichikawai]
MPRFFKRARQMNIKFNLDKLQYEVSEVKYMGHIISHKGVQSDGDKVVAIVNMPPPEDRKSLQRLLGMTKYLLQYIPNEAAMAAPLRVLQRKDMHWVWSHEHDNAISTLKRALTEAPILRFFDPTKQSVLQADASKDGLGACLLQEGQPVAYKAEHNYTQIEKELLAVIFAARNFHQFVFGVLVQSDHKP